MGSEKPSYNDGTHATSAEASRPASSVSSIPLTVFTASAIPSSSMSFSVGPPSARRDTSVRCTSRSVRSFATASNRCRTPFSGTSALATATMRPGVRGASGGRNRSVSTPSGTVVIRSADTRKSSAMSSADARETVISSGIRRATLACIRTKPYHRRIAGRRHQGAAARSATRSRVIGWCTVATSGIPARRTDSRP